MTETNANAEVPPAKTLEDRFGPKLEAASAELENVAERARGVIRTHPAASILAGFAVGFVVGKLASRR